MTNDFDFAWDWDEAQDLETPTDDKDTPEVSTEETVELEKELFDDLTQTEEEPEVNTDDTKSDETEEEENSAENSEEEGTVDQVDIISRLKDLGIIAEDADVTEDLLPDYFDNNTEDQVEEGIQSLIQNWQKTLSDDGARFLQFSRDGGSFEDYLKVYSETPIHLFDITSEDGQKSFLTYVLTNVENRSQEEANDQIEFLEERDSLERVAKSTYSRLQNQRDQKAKAAADALRASRAEAQKNREESRNKLQESLRAVKDFSGYSFSNAEASILTRYITKPTVRVGEQYVSQFFNDVQKVYDSDPQKLMMIAKLLKSDFDFSFVERAEETKVTKKAKKVINQSSKKSTPASERVVYEY